MLRYTRGVWIRSTNWLEVGEGFQGPLNIYGKTVARLGHNRPYDFTPRQVRFCDEISLTADKEAIESLGDESVFDKIRKLFSRQNDADKDPFRDTGPHSAVDRNPWTFWEAPAGSCLIVDLGEVRTINRFRLESAGLFKGLKYNAVEAELYVSIDGDNFANAGKMSLDRSNFNATYAFSWGDVAIEPIQARYVRLNVTRPGTDGKIRIASFDVFGY